MTKIDKNPIIMWRKINTIREKGTRGRPAANDKSKQCPHRHSIHLHSKYRCSVPRQFRSEIAREREREGERKSLEWEMEKDRDAREGTRGHERAVKHSKVIILWRCFLLKHSRLLFWPWFCDPTVQINYDDHHYFKDDFCSSSASSAIWKKCWIVALTRREGKREHSA